MFVKENLHIFIIILKLKSNINSLSKNIKSLLFKTVDHLKQH